MTAVLRLAARCEVASNGGARAAMLLEAGDTVALGPGTERRICHTTRTVLMRDAGRRALWPVAVPAGSLGEGMPGTDLVVAPDQMLPLPGGLGAPARCLVDGVAIRRVAPEGPIDLVELHLDAPFASLAPDAELPGLVESLAATRLPPAGPPEGAVDQAGHGHVVGWARDATRPGQPLLLTLEIDGTPRALFLADLYRADLVTAASDGHCGFGTEMNPPLSRRDYHHMAIRRAWDRAPVPGGDALLDPAPPVAVTLAVLDGLRGEARARALSAALTSLGEAARG